MTIPTASNFLELRHASTAHAIFVVAPERRFLAVDGIGEPNAADFRFATSALHAVADIVLRRLRRAGIATATRVGVAECLWWPPQPLSPAELPAAFADRTSWHWRQLIELPGPATETDAVAAIDEARRGADRDTALVRRLDLAEGSAAQMLHVGPVSTEPVTLRLLFEGIVESDLRPAGRLHTLLLTDGHVSSQGIGRSILRQPVA
jgi:hypothetical protein